jgi:hypothetical protein
MFFAMRRQSVGQWSRSRRLRPGGARKGGDPLIGLAITLVILQSTWDSWHTVSSIEPGEVIGD